MTQNFPFFLVPAEKIWSQQKKSSAFRLKVQQFATLKAPHHIQFPLILMIKYPLLI
jgi:hypothetical protein